MAEKLTTPVIYLKLGTPAIELYSDTKKLSSPVIRLVEVSGNILESCKVTSPHGREDECAKFIISDIEDAYGLRDIMAIGTEYTLSFWMKSDVSGYVRTSGEGTFKASSEWQKCVVTFNAEDEDLVLSFDKEGTYYIYHIQLELGNTATDYRPANEDVDEGISTAQKAAEDAQAEAKANEEALKKFVAEDFAEALVAINNQIDKKSETWHQTTDPSLEWTGEAKNHVGDLWHNPNTNESYIYTSSGASDKTSEAVGNKLAAPSIALYTWVPSYEIPQQVFDDIDGKAQIFTSKPINEAYYINDLLVEGSTGDIKVCISDRDAEKGFQEDDWVKASKYTDDTLATQVKVTVDGLTITDEDGTTLIDGGLIKTGSIVALGKVTAGEFDLGSGKFKVSEDGTLEASGAKISGEIDATNLTLGEKVQIDYSKLKNTPSIPSSIADLDPNSNVLYKSDVTVSEETTDNGIKTETVTVGDQEFKVIKNDDFVLLGKPYGVESVDGKLAKPLISLVDDDAETYTYISKDGLLIGRNALIYGTIYANAGEFRGHLKAKSLKLESGADVDFLKFDPDSGEGLIIGDMTTDELGSNVQLDAYGMNIREGEDTVASFRKSRIALLNGAADMRVSRFNGIDYFTLDSDRILLRGEENLWLSAETDMATEWAEFYGEASDSPRSALARVMAATPLIADDAVGDGEQGYGEARIELKSIFDTYGTREPSNVSINLYVRDERLGTEDTKISIIPGTIALTGNLIINGEPALTALLGYTPSYIQVRTTAGIDTWSTSLQYFYPFGSNAEPTIWSSHKGNLTLEQQQVTFGDRENVSPYGIRIGSNIHTVRVHSNTYLSSEDDSPTGVITTLYRWRPGAEQELVAYSQAATHIEHNNGSYGTCTCNAIMAVQEGDFIFVGAWKSTASRKINTPAGNGRTNMIVEAIG